jgi:hemerythrin-like domain-containing protein
MLKEHQMGRDLVARMKAELSGHLSGDVNTARRFKRCADDYIELLNFHIEKENNALFPLAIKHLPEDDLAEMKKGFDRIESEKIGFGKHERFHRMLDRFERIYSA